MQRRFKGKRDGNHSSIVSRFEGLGCSVSELDSCGVPGFPDLVVGCMGVNHLVECKDLETAYGRAGFNQNQTAFNRDWRGEAVEIATNFEEVDALVQRWRAGVRIRR